ncbi:hypothetical protein KXQ82_08695 [Mucilaginibacter sp. HMF5004]|uniref:hypothetical protein n=1 Tax=Mucilaginibacter rivuli TaxID=2857527 RepID=UPI001C602F1D|nr:hypothetical protein [Mucilaginibacter rivuli]MBW4889792.1 hypothetical protein [Mucilaginibacter rivuli]
MDKTDKTFDEAEIELLKEALKRTYKERFEMATRLYKVQMTMSKAIITHKPFSPHASAETAGRYSIYHQTNSKP